MCMYWYNRAAIIMYCTMQTTTAQHTCIPVELFKVPNQHSCQHNNIVKSLSDVCASDKNKLNSSYISTHKYLTTARHLKQVVRFELLKYTPLELDKIV